MCKATQDPLHVATVCKCRLGPEHYREIVLQCVKFLTCKTVNESLCWQRIGRRHLCMPSARLESCTLWPGTAVLATLTTVAAMTAGTDNGVRETNLHINIPPETPFFLNRTDDLNLILLFILRRSRLALGRLQWQRRLWRGHLQTVCRCLGDWAGRTGGYESP